MLAQLVSVTDGGGAGHQVSDPAEFHSLLLIFLAPVSQSSSILDSGPCHYHGSTERGPQQTKLHTQVATCNCGGRDIGKLSLYGPLIGQV